MVGFSFNGLHPNSQLVRLEKKMRTKHSAKSLPTTPTSQKKPSHFNFSSLFRRHTAPPALKPVARVAKVVEVSKPILPQEIHDYILLQLETLHWDPVAPTCSTCLLRDISSYSKVSKEWHFAAIPRLYVTFMDLFLNTAESDRTRL